ncbi:kelch domain-containing protein 10 isoform X1 [Petromyzon marinus]|uniref:Kelch domain-containing protein 10 n=2 Tax=Petromyzon marinus TaxID=7757 RepID=A0AAJ7U376_PETMA|nr:kelch domain-containing protein 10 isoform X1 [Petromyzon marinus]XP_061428750.1 LOW QUALITY PROTEIN: kelch domain-containing protein 10-like [Lethenteron reissneri]
MAEAPPISGFVRLPGWGPFGAAGCEKIMGIGAAKERDPSLHVPNRFLYQGEPEPPARSGHRCIADSANLYVFGGYNPDFDESGGPGNAEYPLFRELWRYHLATGTWHRVPTDGYTPKELASMSVVLHGSSLLTFGGTGVPFGESSGNDVNVCNLRSRCWTRLPSRGRKPSKIYGQAMAIIHGALYVFGGTTGYVYNTDLHRLDLGTHEWVKLEPCNGRDEMPGERYRHEIAHDDTRIYVLGGGTSWMAYPLDKINAYNLENNMWEEIMTKPHDKIGFPAARRCHSCVQIGKDVFICGGYDGERIFGDLWRLNLGSFQWTKLPAEMPEPAYFHCAAVTPAGCMYVHGGVVSIQENRRTPSLYRAWLTAPSLLELCWERLLASAPCLAHASPRHLLQLGLSWQLIDRLRDT